MTMEKCKIFVEKGTKFLRASTGDCDSLEESIVGLNTRSAASEIKSMLVCSHCTAGVFHEIDNVVASPHRFAIVKETTGSRWKHVTEAMSSAGYVTVVLDRNVYFYDVEGVVTSACG